MSYDVTEIEAPRPSWAHWLRTFTVGEEKQVDMADLPSIKVAMHRIKKQTGGKVEFRTSAGFVTRVK